MPTEKYDAEKTYKKCNRYQSGIASIGKDIFYWEGRYGTNPAKKGNNATNILFVRS